MQLGRWKLGRWKLGRWKLGRWKLGRWKLARSNSGVCELALWAVVAGSMAMAWLHRPGFPLAERAEVSVKLALFLAALALVGLHFLRAAAGRCTGSATRRWLTDPLLWAAALAVLVYVNFGSWHGRTYIHYWEQFHYSLNSKYFAELGHDGLYAASVEAQRVTAPGAPLPEHIRDLRTNLVLAPDAEPILAHRNEVRGRFSPERWRDFVIDHGHFVAENRRDYLDRIRRDHGYNPPPSWTFVAQLFSSRLRLDAMGLSLLASIDFALLAVLFAFVCRTFGGRTGLLALVFFGFNYAGRYFWVGGAFLREDWLVAAGIAVCMMQRRRFKTAGALLGYAAMMRIFPVLLLLGPAVVAMRLLLQRSTGELEEDRRWPWQLALGFAGTAVALFVAGAATGRGFAAWTEFAATIELHRDTFLTNNVGLDNVLLYGSDDLARRRVDWTLPEPWIHQQAHINALRADREGLIWSVRVLFLLLLGLACWRSKPHESAILSTGAIFGLVLTTCYYWQILLLMLLLGSVPVTIAVLALNLAMMTLHFASESFEFRYGIMSWLLLLLFFGLYLQRAGVFASPAAAAKSPS